MPPSDFANADLDEIVEKLTQDEAILLTAGVGFWYTHAVPRLGIPSIKCSDGPNGIRGGAFFMSTPAKCLPSSTAMGATWDTDLIELVGRKLLAEEAKLRASSLILAPTCNIQRNPLGGRSFESFAEDPHLSGMISAAYVNGVQSGGIGTTIKHFVGNDKEDDRFGYDSIISDRALREIYLMPFMLAQKHAKPWSFMTAYNRVNGTHVSENPLFLKQILRDEWKFTGMTMSDWFGVYGVDGGINAGLDLEMPGDNKWRTLEHTARSIFARKITLRTVKERARSVLELVQRCAKECPEVVDGPDEESTVDTEETRALMREVAAKGIVLLKNEGQSLPIKPQNLKKIAIVGGNAKAIVLSGGGSAALKSSYFITPYDGITSQLPDNVEVVYSEGARTSKVLPTLDYEIVTDAGERGWVGEWYPHESDDSMKPIDKAIKSQVIDETRMFINTAVPDGLTRRWTMRLTGYLKPRATDGDFEFGIEVAGRARLFVDGKLVVESWERQRRGEAFFNQGCQEVTGVFPAKANTKHKIEVEFCNVRAPADGDEDEIVMENNSGIRLGGASVVDSDQLLNEAVALAKDADVVIAVVGINPDWETEGYDRRTLALPGRTDELVEKVVAANPKTIVVTQAGSAITLPWADKVPAIVHTWYLGNATGDAIADVLLGKVNPGGKLSLTFPKAEEDLPSFGHFHTENGKVRYAEDLYVGYKHYQHRKIEPAFAFGHGLSYTTFALENLAVSKATIADKEVAFSVSVDVKNTGSVAGSEVVQVYLSVPYTPEYTHPALQLRGFAKVRDLAPGKTEKVDIKLDKYAVSYWDDKLNRWIVPKGEFKIKVGNSSENLTLEGSVAIDTYFEWSGL
ncbi:glycoside hydrolase family 3 protein [Cylindrobasidium torrendii FP15055 ss-10]|uniref:beta-glucosidase n=1 Tax=Cylindrobasidium torrendii FP15055 ss-10 TaxID=1314674 RepID=A0A0D7BLR7_9AGAR|nr:glycoside hydrolase family 3 protein [Cylindrobasidium torrendii FP15055 ss-10]